MSQTIVWRAGLDAHSLSTSGTSHKILGRSIHDNLLTIILSLSNSFHAMQCDISQMPNFAPACLLLPGKKNAVADMQKVPTLLTDALRATFSQNTLITVLGSSTSSRHCSPRLARDPDVPLLVSVARPARPMVHRCCRCPVAPQP